MRSVTVIISFLFSVSLYAQNISGVVNVYRKVLWADSASGRVKLSNVSGFAPYVGNKAMLIQMKGAVMDQNDAATFGNISPSANINNAGNYEIGTICSFLSDTLVFERKLNNFYDVGGKVQCIILPKYIDATVVDTLKAAAWDSASGTGGVLALEVTGTLTLNKPLSADGAGFAGGSFQQFNISCVFTPGVPGYYYPNSVTNNNGGKKGEGIGDYIAAKEYGRGKQTNGGGGGNNHNAGGAGGGNYGTGGSGGENTNGVCRSNTPGIGGLGLGSFGYALSPSSQNKIFFGGGGGAGHDNNGYGMPGANGGGIIYILANEIKGAAITASDNKISANGDSTGRFIPALGSWQVGSWSDGSGGGGGGGVVILNVNSFSGNNIITEAKGGRGGNSELSGNSNCSGPGGGGGGGVVWFKSAALPATVTSHIEGGANGIIQFSALGCNGSASNSTAGSAGTTLFNFTQAIKDSSPICMGLVPLQIAISLNGSVQNSGAFITAVISNPSAVQHCFLQKADAAGLFKNIADQQGNNSIDYHFTDNIFSSPFQLYRIKIVSKVGRIYYSPVLRMNKNGDDHTWSMDVFPNPSKDKLSLQVNALENGIYNIRVLDHTGKICTDFFHHLAKGRNTISLSLENMPQGILFIQITGKNVLVMKPLMKF